jgi:predicted outer membrane protein
VSFVLFTRIETQESHRYRAIASLLVSAPLLAFGIDANVDSSFFKNAAEGGMAQVDAGKLAQQKGSSPAVKEFGAMMVKDHSAANAKLAKHCSRAECQAAYLGQRHADGIAERAADVIWSFI